MINNTNNILVGFEVEGEYRPNGDYDSYDDDAYSHYFESIQTENHEDGSVSSYSDDLYGREVVTIPLVYDSTPFKQFFTDLAKYITSGDLHLNRTCGLHFHVSFPFYAWNNVNADLVNAWQAMVQERFPALWRARCANSYCTARKQTYISPNQSRYQAFNVASATEHGTIEIRLYGYYQQWSVKEYKRFMYSTIHFLKKELKKRTVFRDNIVLDMTKNKEILCVSC